MELFSKIRDFNPVEEVFGNWQSLDSSNVAAYRYNKGTRVLQIRFHSGRVYGYKDVPENIADGLGTADSPGKYVNSEIKHSYSLE
jgi:KTSC domain